jgi:hypothetical protein
MICRIVKAWVHPTNMKDASMQVTNDIKKGTKEII